MAAADDACRDADDRISEIGNPAGREGVREYVGHAREISRDLVADLRAIDPPEADREEVDGMIDALERATDLLEPLAQAAADRDVETLEELQQEMEQITDDIGELAQSYGFEICGAKVLDPVR